MSGTRLGSADTGEPAESAAGQPPGPAGAAASPGPAGTQRQTVTLHAVAAAASVVALGPALGPGHVLAYDMVSTPRVPWTAATLGWGDGLARAVPQDAVLALATTLVPGMVVQKVALVAVVYLAVLGAARLAPTGRTAVQVVAGLAYGWNAYLAERLFLGHWSLLLAYAALPWMVRAALRARAGGRAGPVLGWAALASLTATGGVLALATAAAVLCWPGNVARGTRVRALAGLVALQAPWLLAGLFTPGLSGSDPAGVDVFAARAENASGVLGALLGLGGVWNADAVPVSRTTLLAPVLTAVVLAAAAYGVRVLRARLGAAGGWGLGVAAGAGLVVAGLGATAPGREALRWLVAEVPGAGLVRDGQKFLAPFALLVAVAFALGVERLAGRLTAAPAVVVLAAALAFPLVALPDLAWGGLGRLAAVRYPADWDRTASYLAGRDGELVAVPFSAFRAYPWNGGRTALDPAARYLPVAVVADDRLAVGDSADDAVVAGESTRAAEVGAALAAGRPLASTGVRWVLVQRDTPGVAAPPASLDGLRVAVAGTHLTLYENPHGRPAPAPSATRRAAVLTGYAVAAGVLLLAGGAAWRGVPPGWWGRRGRPFGSSRRQDG